MRYSWDVEQDVHAQCHFTGTPGMPASQTIFLRGYSISVRPDPSFQSLVIVPAMPSRRFTKVLSGDDSQLAIVVALTTNRTLIRAWTFLTPTSIDKQIPLI